MISTLILLVLLTDFAMTPPSLGLDKKWESYDTKNTDLWFGSQKFGCFAFYSGLKLRPTCDYLKCHNFLTFWPIWMISLPLEMNLWAISSDRKIRTVAFGVNTVSEPLFVHASPYINVFTMKHALFVHFL